MVHRIVSYQHIVGGYVHHGEIFFHRWCAFEWKYFICRGCTKCKQRVSVAYTKPFCKELVTCVGAWEYVAFSFCKINNQRNSDSFKKIIYGDITLLYCTEYIFEFEFCLLLGICAVSTEVQDLMLQWKMNPQQMRMWQEKKKTLRLLRI